MLSHCFSLQFSNGKRCYLFIHLFAICQSLVMCLVRSFGHLFSCWVSIVIFIFGIGICIFWIGILQRFSPSLWSVFYLNSVFCRTEVFNFNEIQLSDILLSRIMLLVSHLKSHCQTWGHLDFLFPSKSCIVCILHLGLRPSWVNFYERPEACM